MNTNDHCGYQTTPIRLSGGGVIVSGRNESRATLPESPATERHPRDCCDDSRCEECSASSDGGGSSTDNNGNGPAMCKYQSLRFVQGLQVFVVEEGGVPLIWYGRYGVYAYGPVIGEQAAYWGWCMLCILHGIRLMGGHYNRGKHMRYGRYGIREVRGTGGTGYGPYLGCGPDYPSLGTG